MIARTQGGVTTTYDWNTMNRLRQVQVGSSVTQTTSYDHGGIRRLKKDWAGLSKSFSSGAMSLCESRLSGAVSFVQGHQLLGLEQGGNLFYLITDGLANVRLVLDSMGSIVASSVFDEFGIPEDVSGSADLRPHGYTGGLGVRNDWDSSGLHHMRQRYYDPQLGRWLSAVPIGFSGGLNLYTYVENNPTRYTDPSGTDVWALFGNGKWLRAQTGEGFVNLLKRGNRKNGGIKYLEFDAHGKSYACGFMDSDPNGEQGFLRLLPGGGVGVYGSRRAFSDPSQAPFLGNLGTLANGHMSDKAIVFFDACETAENPEKNLARSVSRTFPFGAVVGSPSKGDMVGFGDTQYAGRFNAYVNGDVKQHYDNVQQMGLPTHPIPAGVEIVR